MKGTISMNIGDYVEFYPEITKAKSEQEPIEGIIIEIEIRETGGGRMSHPWYRILSKGRLWEVPHNDMITKIGHFGPDDSLLSPAQPRVQRDSIDAEIKLQKSEQKSCSTVQKHTPTS